MAIRYVDLVNGNDANNGTTFALRKKTINSATSGLTGNDTVRVMQSPSPTLIGNCTWSASGRSITLPQSVTAPINTCESGWTASTNVTATYSASAPVMQGTNKTQLAIAAAFTTGKAAYATCATVDLSAYQQISLFFVNTGAAIAANNVYIDLCSDSIGAVPVVSFALPPRQIQSSGISPHTFDYGAALPSNVNSIAIRCVADPGALTLQLDHIIACKASSDVDSITFNSIIGLNTENEPEWYAIKSIEGTTLTLDIYSYWEGTTGSIATYKMQPLLLPALQSVLPAGYSATTTSTYSLSAGGNYNGPLSISYGWDTTDMSTQTGYTCIDIETYSGKVHPDGGDYISVDRLITVRAYDLFGTSQYSYINLGICHAVAPYRMTLHNGTTAGFINIDKFYITCHTTSVAATSSPGLIRADTLNIKYNSFPTSGYNTLTIGAPSLEINNLTVNGLGGNGVNFNSCNEGYIQHLVIVNGNIGAGYTSASGLSTNNANLKIKNYTLTGPNYVYNMSGGVNTDVSIENVIGTGTAGTISSGSQYPKNRVFIQNNNGTGSVGMTSALQYQSVTTPVHTVGGVAWSCKNMSLTNKMTTLTDWYKYNNLLIAQIPVKANKLVTASIWVRRAYTTTSCAICVKPNISGLTDWAVSSQPSGAANTWEQITLTFTPTINTVAEILFGCQYDAANAAQLFYFDDLSVTIAD